MKKYFTIILLGISFLVFSQKKVSKSKKTINFKVVDMNTQAKKDILKYNKIINLDPTNAEAYYNRGFEKYIWLNDYKGAILDFTNSIKFGNDQDSETYYLRGDAKFKLNDYRGAISDYNIAIEIEVSRMNNQESDDGYEARGMAKLMLEDFEGAKADFTNSIEFNSENSKSYYFRGYCDIILKNTDSGCLDFSKAGELGYSEAYDMIEKFCK